MIKKNIAVCIIGVFISLNAFAQSPPKYMWIEAPVDASGVNAMLGFGILNKDYATGSGASVFFDASTSYALSDQFGLGLNIPLAGTFSENDNGLGLGNISLDATYYFQKNTDLIAGLNIEAVFASATNSSAIGTTTRNFYRYAKDQWALVPRAIVGYQKNNIQLLGQLGLPIQFLREDAKLEQDWMETFISYDLGLSVATSHLQTFWITAEVGGYTSMSYDTLDNQTEFFGSLGVKYQDDEIALGVSLATPFTENARDAHHVLLFADFSYRF